MALEENKALVRRVIGAYTQHDLDWFDEFIAPEYIDHANHVGPEGVKQLFKLGFKGFPDWHETIEEIIAEGDKVWVRLTYTGTHAGEFFGRAPAGKKVNMTSVAIHRVVNGKHVDGRFIDNNLDMLA